MEKLNLLEGILKVSLVICVCVYIAWGVVMIRNRKHKKEEIEWLERERYNKEKKEYNGCKCVKCGETLKFTKSTNNERVYVCPGCLHTVIITDYTIDENYGD